VARKHYLQVTDEHFVRAMGATQNATHLGAVQGSQEPSAETVTPAKRGKSEELPVLVNLPSSPGRTRTYDKPVNSRLLYQLSYRGVERTILISRGGGDKALGSALAALGSAGEGNCRPNARHDRTGRRASPAEE
jgi:hypothetical protein